MLDGVAGARFRSFTRIERAEQSNPRADGSIVQHLLVAVAARSRGIAFGVVHVEFVRRAPESTGGAQPFFYPVEHVPTVLAVFAAQEDMAGV